jgi:hypothetical protein
MAKKSWDASSATIIYDPAFVRRSVRGAVAEVILDPVEH